MKSATTRLWKYTCAVGLAVSLASAAYWAATRSHEIDRSADSVDFPPQADSFIDDRYLTQPNVHPLLGKSAPACELDLLDRKPISLQAHIGKETVVLDFWASWCPPCLESLPALSKVAAEFADRDVAFYAVNLGDDESTVRELLKRHAVDVHVVMDAKNVLGEMFLASAIPLTIIIDTQGTVQVAQAGVPTNHETVLAHKIAAVLAGEPLAEQSLAAAADQRDLVGPILQSPDAATAREVEAEKLAYNRHTLVDAYQAHGSHNSAWDDGALTLLEEVARYFSNAEGLKSATEIVAMAKPVIANGCDDPLIKYCYAVMLQFSDSSNQDQIKAYRLLKESYDGLVEQGYPANRRFGAVQRVWQPLHITKPNSEETDKFQELRIKEALACIQQDDVSNNEGRQLLALINEMFGYRTAEQDGKFYARAKAYEDQQPFLVNMLGGAWHLNAAWEARGGGWASEVTKEGWHGYSEHVAAARTCFVKAWQAAPRRPEAAARMIEVARLEGEAPLSDMRLWFDRAVEVQFDYKPAYDNLLQGLWPRWGGSFEAMYRFGVQCKATERYDTDVPYMFCEALWDIGKDTQNSQGMSTLRVPDVYENAHEVCSRYMEVVKEPHRVAWWKSVDLGFACWTENWNAAAAILDETSEVVDDDALGRFALSREEVIADVRLHTCPQAEMLVEVFSRGADQDRDQNIRQLTELVDDRDLHRLVRKKIASRLQELRWLNEFESGEVVSLDFNGALDGWKVKSGTWSRKSGGGAIGISTSKGVILLCDTEFGPRWELSGEWEYFASPQYPWDAGVYIYSDGARSQAIMYNPTQHWIAAGPLSELQKHQQPLHRDGKVVPFKLRLNDGVIDVWIGDDLVIKQQKLPRLLGQAAIQIAVGAKYPWEGAMLIYRNLTIKRID